MFCRWECLELFGTVHIQVKREVGWGGGDKFADTIGFSYLHCLTVFRPGEKRIGDLLYKGHNITFVYHVLWVTDVGEKVAVCRGKTTNCHFLTMKRNTNLMTD